MKRHRSAGIRKRMIFYFLLIATANVVVAGEFAWEMKQGSYRTEFTQNVAEGGVKNVSPQEVRDLLDRLVNKFIAMILILVVVTAVVLSLFVVRIASPLQYMIDQAERMTDGDLSTHIEVKREGELSLLANLINDLSVNFQEIIAQLNRISADIEKTVAEHQSVTVAEPGCDPAIITTFERLYSSVQELRTLKEIYTLYTIHRSIPETESRPGRG